MGAYLLDLLEKKLTSAKIREIRGKGLMIGIELAQPCPQIVHNALAHGLLINLTAERVIRLLPPLILTNTEADEAVERLSAALKDTETQ